jgi:hypothetical protein
VTSNDDGDTLWVVSTRGPDGDPVCEFTWGPHHWYAPVGDVRATATDLITCAAYAEMMMALASKLNLPGQTAAAFTTDLLATSGRTQFGTPRTVDLLPAGNIKAAEPVVLLRRGPMSEWEGVVSPAAAREMARAWFAAAEASESDRLVVKALAGTPADDPVVIESLFERLRELRDEDAA